MKTWPEIRIRYCLWCSATLTRHDKTLGFLCRRCRKTP